MFTVTPQAAQQILAASQQHGIDDVPNLRIAARRSMDGSIEYGLGFDDLHDEDMQIPAEGLNLLIAPHSEPLLQGATLDYVELTPGDFQFIFMNPNDMAPSGDGGCGSSSKSSGGGCGSGGCGSGGGCS
jgi:iron-sulfur cluster assembly protein